MGVVHGGYDFFGPGSRLECREAGAFCEAAQHERDACQLLAQAIMQIGAQAPPFSIGDFYDLGFQLLALRNVLHHEQNPLLAAQFDFRGQHFSREMAAVAPAKQHVALAAAAMLFEQAFQYGGRSLTLPRVEQLHYREPDEFPGLAAEYAVETPIGVFYS